MMRRTFLTSALDMPEIMSYIYSKSWKLQFSASSSIIIIEDYYLQTFLHSLEYDINETVYPIGEACRKNLLVLMTLTESFYCFTDGLLLFLGGSVDEMLDCIVGECRKPIEIE